MRKINPDAVKADFAKGLQELSAFHAAAVEALAGEAHRSFLAESTLLSAAVRWERYLSDLFVAYINRDSTQFANHLQTAFRATVKDKARRTFDAFGQMTIPDHLKRDRILELIDPHGGNITFRNYEELVEGAKRYLVEAHRLGIEARDVGERRTIDALIALRNHLAHRSRQSYGAMNDALNAGALHPTGLRRRGNSVRNVGPWLKARPTTQQPPRIEIFLARISAIGAAL